MASLKAYLGAILLAYLTFIHVQGQLLNQLQNGQLRNLYRNQQLARSNTLRNLNQYLQQGSQRSRVPQAAKPSPYRNNRYPVNPAKYLQQQRRPLIKQTKDPKITSRLVPSAESVPSCIEAVSAAIQSTPYIDARKKTLFYTTNGTVNSLNDAAESACTFEQPCTWNVFPAGVGKQVKNKLHPSIISYCFEVAEVPSGEFLIFNSELQEGKETTARFVSSTIQCSKSKISVNFKHWATKAVTLQVCLRETVNLMWHCVNVPGSSGLSTAVLAQPNGSFNVVILARNFGAGSKSAMLLDDVSIDYEPCDNVQVDVDAAPVEAQQIVEDEELDETTPLETELIGGLDEDLKPLPIEEPVTADQQELDQQNIQALSERLGLNAPIDTSQDHYLAQTLGEFNLGFATGSECSTIECDFEQGHPCEYMSSSSPGAEGFAVQSGRYKNRITGILQAGEGEYYAAAYLRENQESTLTVNVILPERRVVRFLRYDTTESLKLSGCCSTMDDCPYKTPDQVDPAEGRTWVPASFDCPKGTDKIIFVCSNPAGSQHQGACGIDQVKLLLSDDGYGPEEAVIPACGGAEKGPFW